MSPIDPNLSDSLASLSSTIRKAESALKKMPAAEHAHVDVDYLYSRDHYMVVRRDDESNCRLAIILDLGGVGEDAEEHVEWVDEAYVARRVKLAKLIPELIDLAKASEGEFAEEVQEVDAEIEQKLSELE